MDLFGNSDSQKDVIYDDNLSTEDGYSDSWNNGDISETEDGLSDPQTMPFCLGHEAQEALFIDLFKKGTMPHAIIFSGLEGIGKTTMAFRLARFLFKHGKSVENENQGGLFGDDVEILTQEIVSLDVDPSDYVFHLIASGGHPDFLHIHRGFYKSKEKQDATLKVEAVREIEPFLRRTASDGGWRVVVVEDADTMNRSAQNAILKILEEPPANVLIILIAHRPGMLIPTIHSRARNIQFFPLSALTIETLLAKKGEFKVSPSDVELITVLCEGSVGQALKFIENDGLAMLKKILEHMEYAGKEQLHKIHEFSASFTTHAQEAQYRMMTYMFLWILRKVLFVKARGNIEVPAYILNNATANLSANNSLEKLIFLNDEVKNIFRRVDFSNLDRRDAVRAAFLMIGQ
ncbi:MAG: DNA polymerase III subunit delta' [Alphaproteobacteria bacterium]|nr:DNA polymerase III subunit delta' [Alphaproteobacteria bacterium]